MNIETGISYEFSAIISGILSNNPTLEACKTLVFNHALKDESTPISEHEKNLIAQLYFMLGCSDKNIGLIGIAQIEGVQVLIDELKTKHQLLITAIKNGDIDRVNLILTDKRTILTIKDTDGRMPLFLAIHKSQEAIAHVLLKDKRNDLNRMIWLGFSPLSMATQLNQANIVQAILENIKDQQVNQIQHAFYIACHYGFTDIVSVFLTDGRINPNQQLGKYLPPLIEAIRRKHLHIIELLLSHESVNPNVRSGLTLSSNAEQALSFGIVNTTFPLELAIDHENIELIKRLLAHKNIMPNQLNFCGNSLLHLAVIKGNIDVVQNLLTDGRFDINQRGFFGRTPLMTAVLNGHIGAVNLLLRQEGIDPNISDDDGVTPLYIAAQFGQREIVNQFLANQRALNYLLRQIINRQKIIWDLSFNTPRPQPKLTRADLDFVLDAPVHNPVLFQVLCNCRNELWQRLRDPSSLDITEEAHVNLLQEILDSRFTKDKHPLYSILFSTSTSLFRPNSIFKEMQTMISDEAPEQSKNKRIKFTA